MDRAATPVKIHVTLWQVIAAFAVCVVLFGAGFAAGRVTGSDDPTTDASSAPDPLSGSAVGAAGADESSGAEGGAEGAEASAGIESSAASIGVTVEGLEAALATVDLGRLTFEHGTDQLTADGQAAAGDIATILAAHPFIPVEVELHTFTEATPGDNHGLSVLQAEAVLSAMVANGVEPGRLTGVGLGGSYDKPEGIDQLVRFASNDSEVDRMLDAIDFLSITFDGDGRLNGGDAAIGQMIDALSTNPSASLHLIGYAYRDDPGTSHDLSHTVTDEVTERLVAGGIERERIDVVGLGDAPTQIDGTTEVEFEVGLPAALTLALRDVDETRIQFEPGSDRLTPDGAAALTEVANALLLDPEQRVEISAHSFSEATSSANHQLSHLQGDAVVAALAAAGVDPERLELEAHGDPIAFRQGARPSYISFYPLD